MQCLLLTPLTMTIISKPGNYVGHRETTVSRMTCDDISLILWVDDMCF